MGQINAVSQRYVGSSWVADLLGIDITTVQKLCRKKLLPHYLIGNRYRFREDEILEFLESNHHVPEEGSNGRDEDG